MLAQATSPRRRELHQREDAFGRGPAAQYRTPPADDLPRGRIDRDRQRDFLDHGVKHIKPMMLKDIAEDIGMHLSTVSRVVNRKYAHTPQGVIELRRFFTEGMLNEDGEEVSTRIIKLKIKKLIEEEDSHNPITDDQVVKILVKDGIKLSRRTVAKYRDQMNIPGSQGAPGSRLDEPLPASRTAR